VTADPDDPLLECAAFLESFGLGWFTVDGEGRITSWSPALASWTGWTAARVITHSAEELLVPATRSGGDGAFGLELVGAVPQLQHATAELRCANGEVVVAQLTARRGRDQVEVLVVRLRDAVALPGPNDSADDSDRENQELVGESGPMAAVRRRLRRAAPSDVSVMITGESGTGKELAARALHRWSARHGAPFVAVNCATFQESLLESELFGHVAGSFTGAQEARVGLIPHADGGTLFLDEVGEVSPAVQVKLLRVLQEREVRPVGSNETTPVDIRLITATHRSPEELLAEGRLRADFYYRIRVFDIVMPPLRERKEDIPLLVGAFLDELRHATPRMLSKDALACMAAYDWPGNVRELRNAMEHAVVAADGPLITPGHLPSSITRRLGGVDSEALDEGERRERQRIVSALELHGWNRTRAAEALEISRVTLWKKIRRYRLDPSPFRRR